MKPSLEDKTGKDMALNLRELMAATGYGRLAIKRMNLPLVCGKMRLSDFWTHHAKLAQKEERGPPRSPITVRSPEPPNDLQSLVNRLRAPRPAH